jgi:hypothetical protein
MVLAPQFYRVDIFFLISFMFLGFGCLRDLFKIGLVEINFYNKLFINLNL